MENTRKIGITLIVIFSLAIFFLIAFSDIMYKGIFISLVVSSAALVPFGFSLLAINNQNKLVKIIYLLISVILICLAIISIKFKLPGGAIELIVGILWFCFAYSPIELKHKYQKWLPYSKSKFESLLLSSLDFIGITALAIGTMFKIQHWPLGNFLQAAGVIVLIIGLFAWNFKFKKEVVRRKEAEDKIQEQFSEIQDSIKYAKRIQSAILPTSKRIAENFSDIFVLYKPKDVVAGDFYWMEAGTNEVLIAACDCTGHGVPGAMVSVVCNNALNRSVREFGLKNPGEILDKTREIVISEFEKSEEEVKDGMDISLVSVTKSTNKLKWSGANNPMWILRSDSASIEELKGDKQPIGKFHDIKSFKTHEIELAKDDIIYLITDGYQDQFGGDKGKKFKASALKELLVSIRKEPMQKQMAIIEKTFENWKGKLEQIDDVCIIGIKL